MHKLSSAWLLFCYQPMEEVLGHNHRPQNPLFNVDRVQKHSWQKCLFSMSASFCLLYYNKYINWCQIIIVLFSFYSCYCGIYLLPLWWIVGWAHCLQCGYQSNLSLSAPTNLLYSRLSVEEKIQLFDDDKSGRNIWNWQHVCILKPKLCIYLPTQLWSYPYIYASSAWKHASPKVIHSNLLEYHSRTLIMNWGLMDFAVVIVHKPKNQIQANLSCPRTWPGEKWPTTPGFEPRTSSFKSWCANHSATRTPAFCLNVGSACGWVVSASAIGPWGSGFEPRCSG